jgi:8-oxo-dGTP diphosphatase
MKLVYSAVKSIIQKDDKFLIVKQSTSNGEYWDLPGGKVEFGESPYDTLSREIREELDLEIKIMEQIGMYWFFRNDGHQVVCTTFMCEAIGEIDLSKDSAIAKIIDYKWVTKRQFLVDNYKVSHISLIDLINNHYK